MFDESIKNNEINRDQTLNGEGVVLGIFRVPNPALEKLWRNVRERKKYGSDGMLNEKRTQKL